MQVKKKKKKGKREVCQEHRKKKKRKKKKRGVGGGGGGGGWRGGPLKPMGNIRDTLRRQSEWYSANVISSQTE